VRVDRALRQGLNQPEVFSGQVENWAQIGLDDAGFKQLGDDEHPDDPLEL
jgi:hypothetical protein